MNHSYSSKNEVLGSDVSKFVRVAGGGERNKCEGERTKAAAAGGAGASGEADGEKFVKTKGYVCVCVCVCMLVYTCVHKGIIVMHTLSSTVSSATVVSTGPHTS